MSKVILFGDGKIAEEIYYYFTYDSPYEVVAFCIDRDYQTKDALFDLPVVPFEDVANTYPPGEFKMFVALGYQQLNTLRERKFHEAKAKGFSRSFGPLPAIPNLAL